MQFIQSKFSLISESTILQVSDNYTSYSAPSPLTSRMLVQLK